MKMLNNYRWLVVVITAIICIYVWIYNNYIFYFLYLIALVYAIYSTPTDNLSTMIKIRKWILSFVIFNLLFSFTIVFVETIFGIDKRPPSCNAIEVRETLDELLKEGEFNDSEKYKVQTTDIIEYSKEENVYYCKGTLEVDIENNDSLKNEDKIFLKESLKKLSEKVKINVNFKVETGDLKDSYSVNVVSHEFKIAN